MSDVRTRLIDCFREVFPSLTDDELAAAQYGELEAWDSLASLTLVAVVEEEFEIFLPDDLVAELTSFERIRAAVVDLTHDNA